MTRKPTYEELEKRLRKLEKQEITERKRTAEALRESEGHLRTLLDFAPYPIVVFTLEGLVEYLNPAFTQIFGWGLSELAGKHIPYVPAVLEEETSKSIKRLFDEKTILRYETKRLTKDGRVLDVIMRGAIYSDVKNKPAGELVIIRDITREKKIARQNEAMLRISVALPEHPDMEMLLDYITDEVKQLLDTEGSFVTLIDEEKQEIFTLGAAYDDKAAQKRIKEMRFSTELINDFVAEKILRTGEPVVVNDTSTIPKPYPMRDKLLGYATRSFLQMPLKSSDRIIGALTAVNKREGAFEQTDIELLNMVAGTVVLSVENAKYSEELKNAYKEVSSLNRAKDKIISHLSHELKTPVSVLLGSLNILTKRLQTFSEDTWKPTMKRAARNLERIVGIQDQVNDIMQNKDYKAGAFLFLLLEQCRDELETLVAEKVGEGPIVESIKQSIEETYGLKNLAPESICLDEYVGERVEKLRPLFSHRHLEIQSRLEPAPAIYLPRDHMRKVIDGLIRNAIENTPDEGKIELIVQKMGSGVELVVRDYGIGISEEHQRRIFEGFFTSQDTMAYSSKRPFDFNAGGKGADLLRMKIFSERYNFKIDMLSSKCKYIPKDSDVCPGMISKCAFCDDKTDCHKSGGTSFVLHFPLS
ncbi:MAG: PAS domain S-box protein [Desulfobacterales bacterium]|nr:PAS domain S-box protein [Desulfobacterales bacterium]